MNIVGIDIVGTKYAALSGHSIDRGDMKVLDKLVYATALFIYL